MRKTFTVFGVYEDNGQVFAHTVQTEDAYAAMRQASSDALNNPDLCIIGALEGEHKLITPGEDNNVSAYAPDLTSKE